MFKCHTEDSHPSVINPRPSSPYKLLTLSMSGTWIAKELYGHVSPLEMHSGNTDEMVMKLDDWLFENKQYFVIYVINGKKIGAAAYRLPIAQTFQPKLFRPSGIYAQV